MSFKMDSDSARHELQRRGSEDLSSSRFAAVSYNVDHRKASIDSTRGYEKQYSESLHDFFSQSPRTLSLSKKLRLTFAPRTDDWELVHSASCRALKEVSSRFNSWQDVLLDTGTLSCYLSVCSPSDTGWVAQYTVDSPCTLDRNRLSVKDHFNNEFSEIRAVTLSSCKRTFLESFRDLFLDHFFTLRSTDCLLDVSFSGVWFVTVRRSLSRLLRFRHVTQTFYVHHVLLIISLIYLITTPFFLF